MIDSTIVRAHQHSRPWPRPAPPRGSRAGFDGFDFARRFVPISPMRFDCFDFAPWRHTGTQKMMTIEEFRDAIGRLGLSQVGAARPFGADARTARRWALGEASVPPTVAMLLRLMLRGNITAEDAAAAQS